ncbi:MAG: hypothetical protein HKM94_03040 [Halobacteria archaeon]|nr:hypothetical protein [Halobacteria archaeon]
MNNDELVTVPIQCRPEIAEKLAAIVERDNDPQIMATPEGLEELEKALLKQAHELCGRIVEKQIQHSIDSEKVREEQHQILQALPYKMVDKGKVEVRLRTCCGLEVTVRVSYFTRKGNRRGKKRYPGLYPGLMVIGIYERCTPGLASEISLFAGMLGSLEEARQVLAERGIDLNLKVVRRISYRFAERARTAQRVMELDFGPGVAGRRVAIRADGGRTRIREKKRGNKTAKGRNRFRGAWREPKLFIIYVVDAEGKLDRSFMPIIDALIRGPDAMFKLLHAYLSQLNLTAADQVLFIADGAPWIWNRIPDVTKPLGLAPEQVHELIDFYHAVEHLGKVASLRKGWSSKQRKSWVRKHRNLLLQGAVDQVISAVKQICRGRNSKAIRTQQDYFVKNSTRMAYKRLRAIKMPIGSGSVESAIRRVVNLRLKGPCLFWRKENAEAILLLRCYWKAGRWNMLKNMSNTFVPEAYA